MSAIARPARAALAALLLVALAGCASQTSAPKATAEKAAAQDDTVEYTPLGSWVPKKAKKTQLKTSEQQQEQTADAMRNITTTAPGYKAGTGR